MIRLMAVVVCLTAGLSFADKPRISVVDFKGPKAAAVKKQLTAKLCKTFRCVKPGEGDVEVPVGAVVTAALDKRAGSPSSCTSTKTRSPSPAR